MAVMLSKALHRRVCLVNLIGVDRWPDFQGGGNRRRDGARRPGGYRRAQDRLDAIR
jgi:hypothetical protein